MAKVSKRRNRYVLDYYDHEGRRKRVTLPKETTLKQAKARLREIESQLANGKYIPFEKNPTFDQVAKEWLQNKKLNIRASTWSVYKGHTENHFNEFTGLKINQISIQKVEKYIKIRQTAGMNISTLRKILSSMRQIFQLAVKRNYCQINPVDFADKPKSQGPDKQIKILTRDEISIFLNSVKDQKYNMLFSLAIFSGARQGELLGLKWSDILWADKQIFIQRSYNNGSFYDTKTKGSTRRIDIGPAMLKKLKEWRLACPPGELDLVFPTINGNPINHNNLVSRHFLPGLVRAGLERIRFHDLRHTYASLLIDQGENIKYIQSQLGHSNPTVTLNVYAHLMDKTNQAAAIKLEKAVLK